jgi:toxin CptA
MNEPAALRIDFLPSRIAGVVTLLAVVATAALVAWLPMEPWLRAVAVIVLGAYGITLVRAWAWRSTQGAVVAIALDANRNIAVVTRDGHRFEGQVQEDSYVGSVLTTIVWRGAGARRSRTIAILPDMLDAEDFRKLRVLLRLGKVKTARE